MKTEYFNYNLPEDLIAQHPPERRDWARMMVLHRGTGAIEHKRISDIVHYLRGPDALALNNTKVIPARVFGHKASGGKVELLLLEEAPGGVWKALMKTSRRPREGDELSLCSGKATATMLEERGQGEALLRIEADRPLMDVLDEEGVPPLPPYIARKAQTQEQIEADKIRYQTVFAKNAGSAAAPTAGLHFTPEILAGLSARGVARAELTLHVGLGTFRPVSAEHINDHDMHHERYVVPADAARTLAAARAAGGRIVAVGSTSARTLESLRALAPAEGSTNIFIHPPYSFRHVDAILTNFHLPKSTLLMMMSAFATRELMMHAYETAVAERYRFFSYGDCMLIL